MKLAKREPRFNDKDRKDRHLLRAFHKPQREHHKKPMPVGCPDDPWCENCRCSADDDVCFPHEAKEEMKAYLATF